MPAAGPTSPIICKSSGRSTRESSKEVERLGHCPTCSARRASARFQCRADTILPAKQLPSKHMLFSPFRAADRSFLTRTAYLNKIKVCITPCI
jgi:hypothetical protein